MLNTLRQKLKSGGSRQRGAAGDAIFYLCTHGITILLLITLLVGVILME